MSVTDNERFASRARPRLAVVTLLLALVVAVVARVAGRLDPILFYGIGGGLLASLGIMALDRLHTFRLRVATEGQDMPPDGDDQLPA